jgi:hypothetical protein
VNVTLPEQGTATDQLQVVSDPPIWTQGYATTQPLATGEVQVRQA